MRVGVLSARTLTILDELAEPLPLQRRARSSLADCGMARNRKCEITAGQLTPADGAQLQEDDEVRGKLKTNRRGRGDRRGAFGIADCRLRIVRALRSRRLVACLMAPCSGKPPIADCRLPIAEWPEIRNGRRRPKRVHFSPLLVASAVLPLLFADMAHSEPKVICVARRPMQPTYPHDVISGVEALLAGVAHSGGSALTECQWQFGDGTTSQRMPIESPLALEARHTYTGPIGRVFRAILTVWDDAGATASDDYYVRIGPDKLRTRAHVACDLALWNLHKRMNRYEEEGVPLGYWDNGYGDHIVGITAGCLQAFENLGNFPFDDPDESPYVDDVRRALNRLLFEMRSEDIFPQNAGYPDLNGNGIGLFCHHGQDLKHIFSSQGLAMMALVMSRDPERVAAVGGPDVLGRTFAEIVQDMVDFAAFGQTDESAEGAEELEARGGWRYDAPNSGESDMACTQWPVLGMMMAEENWGKFGVSVPSWVRSELRDYFLVAAYDSETGGWFYLPMPTSRTNCGLTGIGITCCAWTGVAFSNPMVASGLNYIATHWDAEGQFGHLTSMFSMYAVTNAMRAYGNKMIGEHDWYQEYAEYLLAKQEPDGSWSSEGYELSWPLTTGWAVRVLLEPQTPPVVVIEELNSAQQGTVTINYQLFDDNYDECDLAVEFSVDGGEMWSPATQVGGDALSLVEAPLEGLSRQFLWDTVADIGNANVDNVLFRITPSDGEKGEPAQIVIPGVYNDIVPFEPVPLDVPVADGRGAAFADFDNDDDLDLFVANFGQEDFLFRNDSGTLVQIAPTAGMGGKLPSTCGVWGDYNNDGAMDLYLVVAGQRNRLYAGDGNGSFTDVATQLWVADSGGGTGASWGDYNNDNWLDLYVANDSAFGSARNAIFWNTGLTGFFPLGGALEVDSPFPTRSAAWSDFDKDGNIDLYVANGGVTPEERANFLFHNLSETFPDVSEGAGVSDPRDASAVVWADFNSDGFPDIYVVNSGLDQNALYLNNGDGTFRDATAHAGLEGPPQARGAAVADFDNDGDLDIFVSADGRNSLYINRGDCTFADVAPLAGLAEIADSRGAAWADVNGDGFLELYVANNGSQDVLYLNKRTKGNWLKVRCLTDADGDATDDDHSDDRDAIGAIVEVDLDGDQDFSSEAPDRLEVQYVDGGSGYGSQGQLWPHFGLGSYHGADLRVTFPDGSVVYRGGLSANQTVVIRDIAPRGDFYVQVFTPEFPMTGMVPIGYVMFNSDEKYCDIRVEFSSDSGESWEPAITGQGGDGTTALLSSPLGVFHRYVWDSVKDLGEANSDTVRLRITPYDPDPGPPAETSDFSVRNNTLPWVAVETPFGVSAGEVAIRYTLTDTQSDLCIIRVEYSTDAGNIWRQATMGSGGDGTRALSSSPEGVVHTYVWNSFANIGHSVRDNLKIRITPTDMQIGIPGETGLFSVDNNLPPSATVETPESEQTGDVLLSYRLIDPESDLCSVTMFYSLDGGRIWQASSKAPGGDGTTALKSSPSGEPHTYVWDSMADLGEDYNSAVRMVVIPQDAKTGASAETGDFVVDNLRPAELAFSPDSFFFSGQEGTEPPPSQTLEIWNEGNHSLQWTAGSDAGWLILDPADGVSSSEKNVVQVSVDITGLSAGMYSANITLSAPGAVGSPAVIPVELEVLPAPPSLHISELLLSFNAREGGANPPPQFLDIRNAGGGEMSWNAQADQEWISLVPASGASAGEANTVEVRVDASGFSTGSYSGTITISAPSAANSPQAITVSLDVEPEVAELIVTPSELTFVARRGGPNPPEQELQLRVTGGSEVAWEAHHDATWLSLSPSSGTNSGEETVVSVVVEKAGLYIGTYETEVTFTAVGPPLPSQTVKVTLNVVPIVVPDDFATIQEAINSAEPLDVVSVKPGVYPENVVMENGVEVIGYGAEETTIRGSDEGSVVVFRNVESSRLEGFTITGGSGDLLGRESRVGGGIYCVNSTATVSGCNISDNSATWGGGICVDRGSTLTLEDCTISQNTAASGAGIFCYEDCQAVLERTRVCDNSATESGAGACVICGGLLVMKSCEVVRNSAVLGGGGIFAATLASLDVVSCTIADNEGEGILADPDSTVRLANAIIWSNTWDIVIPPGQDVRHCNIATGGLAGDNGNISENPSFVAPDEGCYDLLPNSPCIDAGLNDVAGLPLADVHGEQRIVAVHGEPITDIGSDEHNPETIFILVQSTPQPGDAGEVTLPFTIWNALSLPATIVAEFSVGGGEWRPASRAGGDGMIDLSSSPTGSPHSFVWDSVPDLKGEEAKSVRLRIRLSGEDARPGGTTAPFSVDVSLSDSDNDGLPDAWEQTVVAADPDDQIASIADVAPDGDPDGDGSDNVTEYIARTDPLDADSLFKASCSVGEGGEIIVRWPSVAGRFYQLYRCEQMGHVWVPIGPRQAGTGHTLSITDETLTTSTVQRYYTVRVE